MNKNNCEFCCNNSKDIMNESGWEAYINNKFLVFSIEGKGFMSEEILYCPICGRKL